MKVEYFAYPYEPADTTCTELDTGPQFAREFDRRILSAIDSLSYETGLLSLSARVVVRCATKAGYFDPGYGSLMAEEGEAFIADIIRIDGSYVHGDQGEHETIAVLSVGFLHQAYRKLLDQNPILNNGHGLGHEIAKIFHSHIQEGLEGKQKYYAMEAADLSVRYTATIARYALFEKFVSALK